MVSLTIPGKPMAKQRPRFVRSVNPLTGESTGYTHTPRETVSYENLIVAIFQQRYSDFELLQGALRLDIGGFVPIPQSWSNRKRDMALTGQLRPTTKPDDDNYLKIVKDALEHVAYHNDSQFVESHIWLWYSDQPRLEIKIDKI